ncbi:MAG: YaaL family protein [Defluviitaleaceae bacterium]|nr:YaaL family protein [Defluviitaleaceae bacterium]MCL2837425.1 YaaL family protein [Defluviitaleaceae bacterium]
MKQLKFGSIKDLRLKIRSSQSTGDKVCTEDMRLVDAVKCIKNKIDIANSNFDSIDDPLLIEGLVYELKSLHVKYDYLIVQCKQRGITVDFY